MKKYIIGLACTVLFYGALNAISSTRGITAIIKNETPQEYIIKLVNLESSQEVLIQVLAPKGSPRDVIQMGIPPELYGVTIFYAPTNKTTSVNAKALRGSLAPGASCAQMTLRSRIYKGEPQIEISSCPPPTFTVE